MRTKVIVLIFLALSSQIFAQVNKVEINGWTNVNTFRCVNDEFKTDPSIYFFSGHQLPNINLKVDDFDCKNKMMTSDFRKALHAEKYPALTIKFLDFTRSGSSTFLAVVEVKMMNVSKKYSIEFSEQNQSLVGNKRLHFSDFNIIPPKKMGGMISVKDELDLFFSLMVN